jgi:phage gp36-like protein
MAYATQQDMQDRYGAPRLVQLTDRADPPAGAIDTVLLARHLDDAAAVIDGYLVGRYLLPLATYPAVLKVHNCTLAYRSLLGDQADEPLLDDCKAILAYLTRVAAGQVNLLPPEVGAERTGEDTVQFSAGTKVMGRDDLVDTDRPWGL